MKFVMLNWRDPENPDAGGAERVTLGYLADLAAEGHDVHWLTHSYPGCASETFIQGVKIHRLGGLVASRFGAIQWVKKNGPVDLIVDQHHGIPWFTPIWARKNSISYIHEVLGPIWKSFYHPVIAVIGQTQERATLWFYRRHAFWTGCRSTSNQLKEIGISDVTIVPYGVDLKPLDRLPVKDLEHPVKLVMVSRLAPNKRVHLGPELVHALSKLGVTAHLTILGRGESEPQIRKTISELGIEDACELCGHVSEDRKMEILQQSHFLVHTSLREGWGLNVIEANSVGTPAAVFPVPGLVDSTLHLQTGYVSEEESVDSLASTLISAIDDPAQYARIRRDALRHASTHLWQAVLPQARSFLLKKATASRASS